MSLRFSPSSNALAVEPWHTAFLSDRDVSAQVPVNFVAQPGIFVTSACFADGVYDNAAAELCMSNLLASEIRRFIFDLYWDPLNRVFSLCPVQMPKTFAVDNSTDGSNLPSHIATLAQAMAMNTISLAGRQLLTSNNVTLSTSPTSSLNSSTSSATTSAPPPPTTTSATGALLVELGAFKCSPTLTVHSIVTLLNEYLSQTSDNINARLQYLIFNIHVATAFSAPSVSITNLPGSSLPQSDEVLSSQMSLINRYFYSPTNLEEDRMNLNASWYHRSEVSQFPLAEYYTVVKLPNNQLATPDGWPDENYVQLYLGKRIISGIGSLDQAMTAYNSEADSDLLFLPGELYNDRAATIDSFGSLSSGCFYDANTTEVSQVNNTWAASAILNIDSSILGFAADNFTSCGISPILNTTLNDSSAGTSPIPYQNFGDQAIFGWASGEPKNYTLPDGSDNSQYRCALMVSTLAYKGHWRVEDCQRNYRVACKVANQPYEWRISANAVPYAKGDNACAGGTSFDVPRTGLQNTYLYRHILASSDQAQDSTLADGVWINFNSLDVESCWVTTGLNGTCPYAQDEDAIRQRQILIPAIAAFVVLLLTLLTILVKCNANRRNSKVRKRGEGGWDYEGVPS